MENISQRRDELDWQENQQRRRGRIDWELVVILSAAVVVSIFA